MKLFLPILIFSFSICSAQKQGNQWYFGSYAGLDFNTAPPTPLSGALLAYDNSSAIADTNGQLLFYTNGENIWNKTNQIMINGSGLLGSNDAGQSCLIIQKPFSDVYYVFTVDYIGGPNGLRYSIVDMSLQNGMGEVTQKNILLYTPTTEKLAAVYDCSLNRYWLITHLWNSADYYLYKIDASGLNTVPLINTIGAIHTGGFGVNNACGQMSISKNGDKLVSARYLDGSIELLDFDITTGTLSNVQVMPGMTAAWGVEFSPDGSKLYLTQTGMQSVKQFDLNAGNINNIINSETIIGTTTATGPGYYAGCLQLGPDDKIYISKWDSHYLATISNPDLLGTSCGFSDNGIYLGGASMSKYGLTRVIAPPCITSSISDFQNNLRFEVYPNPTSGIVNINLLDQSIYNDYILKAYNIDGHVVYEKHNSLPSINLSNNADGIYKIILTSGINIISRTIVLKH